MDETISYPGTPGSMSLRQSVISGWGWGFHTVQGGVDPGRQRFRSVGAVEVLEGS